MINRGNWKLIKSYLKYRAEIAQISEESLRMDETRLRHVLEWADETEFKKVRSIRPTLPDYLLTARIDGRGETLSPAYIRKVINAAQQFGNWLINYRSGYKTNLSRWVDTLKAPRNLMPESKQHEAVTLEEIRAIAAAPTNALWEQRVKAAAIFLFLSGMRIGAFVTLPLSAVDLKTRTVKQWPQLGVKTKNRKHETTYLLNIPDLLKVVAEWDNKVRDATNNNGYWFPLLSSKTGEIESTHKPVGKHRNMRARSDLKKWLNSVGLPYHSPHKFRHGFAVYGIKQAQDMADFKAVSMNLMHSNMSITDGIYSILSQQDMGERIANLGNDKPSQEDIAAVLRQIASQIENKK